MTDLIDVGGVHVKYLEHCPRQLWLYWRGFRPERTSSLVAEGEAHDRVTFKREHEVDLGAAKLDWVDGQAWVHENKVSAAPSPQHIAQVEHYCLLLDSYGVRVAGGILHYPSRKRTVVVDWDAAATERARRRVRQVVAVVEAPVVPVRLPRSRCRGCSYSDFCWVG